MEKQSKSKREPRRITSVNEVKGSKISRRNALDLMKNSRGAFFTAVVTKKDKTKRVINGQFVKGQEPSELGYVKVKEAVKLKTGSTSSIRHINLQTIEELRISGRKFKIQ